MKRFLATSTNSSLGHRVVKLADLEALILTLVHHLDCSPTTRREVWDFA
jgi:hypothetical protein